MFKNHSMIDDKNVLKGDLNAVSKEDLKERLVVAEMVMKKLFERNKYLEDLISQKEASEDHKLATEEASPEKEKINEQEECSQCLKSKKEVTLKEQDLNNRISDL